MLPAGVKSDSHQYSVTQRTLQSSADLLSGRCHSICNRDSGIFDVITLIVYISAVPLMVLFLVRMHQQKEVPISRLFDGSTGTQEKVSFDLNSI